ncbi:MAG: hypothetical protein KBE09_04115 [Candidatus Pacebacteria bacterium]|nr:hypothetical protein [Candidatus Paceibacterota bacterium]
MYLRTMRAVLARCETEHRFWHGAQVVCAADGRARLKTLWRNPELAGIWEMSYPISSACLLPLIERQKLDLMSVSTDGTCVYCLNG